MNTVFFFSHAHGRKKGPDFSIFNRFFPMPLLFRFCF